MRNSVGVMIINKNNNNILLLKRSKTSTYSGYWTFLSGGMNKDESPIEALKREIIEEIVVNPNKIVYKFFKTYNDTNSIYNVFIGEVNNEFKCILNDENEEYGWFSLDNLPTPLFPNLISKLNDIFKGK